jgi:hypothetical protein
MKDSLWLLNFGEKKNSQAGQAAEIVIYFVIPNEVRNLSLV